MVTMLEALGMTAEQARKAYPTLSSGDWRHVWLPEDDRPGFRELEPWQVDERSRKAAQTMTEMVARDLVLGYDVEVRWFEDDAGHDSGFTHHQAPGVIWIRKTGDWQTAMRVAAHETKHQAQLASLGFKAFGPLRDTYEAEATAYELTAMRWFWPR